MTWAAQDLPAAYRRIMDGAPGMWTPAALAALPLTQLDAVFAVPQLHPGNVLDYVNAIRARKGQATIKSRRG